jgi:LysR family transcriptional regulator for bpeEF and oprC
MKFVTCGAPAYLDARGVPQAIDDLARHDLVMHFSGRTGRPFTWDFVVEGNVVEFPASGSLSVDDADANVLCGLHGCGLVQAGAYQVRDHLDSGRLVEVLAAWKPAPLPVSLLFPQRRLVPKRVRLFADWVAGVFAAHPDFNG